jgi:F-type H+-transporting ATPase subunit O
MADPSVKKQLKADGLSGACDKLKMNVLSKNLFICMAEHGRVNKFENVISTFNTLMSAHRGEVICEVTTAKVGFTSLKMRNCRSKTWFTIYIPV